MDAQCGIFELPGQAGPAAEQVKGRHRPIVAGTNLCPWLRPVFIRCGHGQQVIHKGVEVMQKNINRDRPVKVIIGFSRAARIEINCGTPFRAIFNCSSIYMFPPVSVDAFPPRRPSLPYFSIEINGGKVSELSQRRIVLVSTSKHLPSYS